ncbi:cysteate synthase [Streptomyces turgidiscabies]|uniref:Cysteate synthase n=1 Tax=Streptomyces turgidiscabies (strain Car8) TaxID=698760 RepID=L7ESS8_STRT8|nr:MULTISPECIES: cysteate synthase [Streptomyces]ELP62052.1 cysteate synthase [Streptomyces turgidiscabies Car8]MDX3498967.1 cysteate synthase [Streptomyces turgidiscabies]GAQ73414.1 threonine synthase [Streptomyces turgidiscabies]
MSPVRPQVRPGNRHYTLVCTSCGCRYEDDGLILDCPRPHDPAFLRTEYTAHSGYEGSTGRTGTGLFRHAPLLPVARTFPDVPGPVVHHADRLGRRIGLEQLWIAFNGYWPERGAQLPTCTFKDLEAYTVLGRLPVDPPVLVIPSAGNTAAAFAWAATRHQVPCLLVVPAPAMAGMRFPGPLDPCVRIVVLDGGATYSDTIAAADLLARLPGHQAEGGCRNVGRRDGLGTVMLAAAEAIGRLPQTYVQAVGSGTGAIGAHEAARRIRAGCERLPRLLMCQNAPFTPLFEAWRSGGAAPADREHEPLARELTNRRPPFAVHGGVRDVLTESGGDVLRVDNVAAIAAMDLFAETEGIDIEPGAGVALAALADAVSAGRVDRDEVVLLNITGGGRARQARDLRLIPAEPWLRVPWPTGGDGPRMVAEQVGRRLSYASTPAGAAS